MKGEKQRGAGSSPASSSSMGLLQTYDVPSFDIHDIHKVSQLIAELTAGTFTLIYHPSSRSSRQKLSSPHPLLVKCWFEMGSCFKNTLVQPKFVWRVIASTSKEASRRSRIKTIKTPHSVELLDVVRLLVPTNANVDRSLYPFVKPRNAFFIYTNDQKEHLFEAKNEEGRKRFVFAMKLMVARLASKIIVGDKDVFDEFFTPTGKKMHLFDSSNGSFPPPPPPQPQATPVRTGCNVEEASVASGHVGSICSVIVAPVNSESGRNDELWGKSAH